MARGIQQTSTDTVAGNSEAEDWVTFPGGELEGKRPKAVCPACREAMNRGFVPTARTLCFQCYRADLERERALRAAGNLDTGTEERFQAQLPFEQVNRARLAALKAARAEARAAASQGTGIYVDPLCTTGDDPNGHIYRGGAWPTPAINLRYAAARA